MRTARTRIVIRDIYEKNRMKYLVEYKIRKKKIKVNQRRSTQIGENKKKLTVAEKLCCMYITYIII